MSSLASKIIIWYIWAIFHCFSFVITASAPSIDPDVLNCYGIAIQKELNLEKLTGRWYVVEILQHLTPRNTYIDTCIKIDLARMPSERMNLLWNEPDYKVNYTFYTSRMSVWESTGAQTTIPQNLGYNQFAGNIYVLKAVNNNAVITFCTPRSVLYSLILSRSHKINSTELESIHGMVSRNRLPILDKRRYCKNSSTIFKVNEAILYISTIICCVVRKMYSFDF